jgi:hypothetical protein
MMWNLMRDADDVNMPWWLYRLKIEPFALTSPSQHNTQVKRRIQSLNAEANLCYYHY